MNDLDHNEEMLRKRLTEPLEGAPQWAEPGEAVWEGIAASLNKKPSRRRWVWWFLLPLFLLAIGLIFVLQSSIGTPQPEDEIMLTNKRANSASSTESDIPVKKDATDPTSGKMEPTIPTPKSSSSSSNPGTSSYPAIQLKETEIRADRTSTPILPAASSPTTKEGQASHEAFYSENSLPLTPSNVTPQPGKAPPFSNEHDVLLLSELAFLPTLHGYLEKEGPILRFSSTMAPQILKKGRHQLSLQAHGWGADRSIHTNQNTAPKPMDIDREHKNYRFGLGYQWQHKNGWLLGTGLEYQQFTEQSIHERTWKFTKANAQMTPGGYHQSVSVNLPTSLGQMEAQLRIGILEQNAPLDYQEGEEVGLIIKLDQSIKHVRIPLYTGYHFAKNAWFIEARGGVGLSFLADYEASITRILEIRNRIRMREIPLIRRPNGLKMAMWDIHGGVHIGRQLTDNWKLSAGYEVWQSISSIASRPGYNTSLNGQGVTIGLHYQF